ncbi:MAG TPA: hypothetical protein VKT82_30240 [Ktedonobacterales bacterium]|nr:hypothetical protein [Ktedonobacterales bacterium]
MRIAAHFQLSSNSPPAVGTTSTRVGSFLGRKGEAQSEITALELNRELCTTGTVIPAKLSATLQFEAAGQSTRLSGTYQIASNGLFQVLGSFLAHKVKKQLAADFHRRKRRVGGAGLTRLLERGMHQPLLGGGPQGTEMGRQDAPGEESPVSNETAATTPQHQKGQRYHAITG